jgi:hypothetical protein
VSLEAASELARFSFLPPERLIDAHQQLYQTSSIVASLFQNFLPSIDSPDLPSSDSPRLSNGVGLRKRIRKIFGRPVSHDQNKHDQKRSCHPARSVAPGSPRMYQRGYYASIPASNRAEIAENTVALKSFCATNEVSGAVGQRIPGGPPENTFCPNLFTLSSSDPRRRGTPKGCRFFLSNIGRPTRETKLLPRQSGGLGIHPYHLSPLPGGC